MIIFGFDSRYRSGICVGIICALTSAIYSIFNKKITTLYDNQAIISWQLTGGSLFMIAILPCYYTANGQWSLHVTFLDAIYLFLAGTICTAGMYLLQLQVLQKISAFTLMLTYNLEPVYSIILAMILFNEAAELNSSFYIGILFIVLSVGLKTSKALYLTNKSDKSPSD
jgi:drug/metabolite transporter (DMT)-like permease